MWACTASTEDRACALSSYKSGCPSGSLSSLYPSGVAIAKWLHLLESQFPQMYNRDYKLYPTALCVSSTSFQAAHTATVVWMVKIWKFLSKLANNHCPRPCRVPCGPLLMILPDSPIKTQRGLGGPASALFQVAT